MAEEVAALKQQKAQLANQQAAGANAFKALEDMRSQGYLEVNADGDYVPGQSYTQR